MLKTLLRDAAVYGASTVLTRAVALLLVPVYTRVLVPAEYGAIDILGIFANFVTLTVALEVTQAVARFLPDARTVEERQRLVSTAALFSIGVYTIFLAVSLFFAEVIWTTLVGGAVEPWAMVASLCSIWTVGIFQLLQNNLRFSLQPVAFTVASLVYSLTSISVSVLLVVGFSAGVGGVMVGQAAGGLLGSIVAGWFGRSLYALRFSTASLRRMLGFSVPLVPAGLGVFVTIYIDRIALNELASLTEVGIFGIGYRLASIVALLVLGFQMALTPLVYQRYRDPSTPGELARIFRAFVAVAAVLSLALSLWAPEALRLATTPAYYAAEVIVPLMAPAILLAGMYVFMPGLAIARQTRMIGVITISGAVLNTVLNFALIPFLGVSGAALATLTSSAAIFAAHATMSQRHYRAPHRWSRFAVVAAAYVLLVALGLLVGHGTPLAIGVKLAAMAGMLLTVVAAGLVTRAEVGAVVSRARDLLARSAR